MNKAKKTAIYLGLTLLYLYIYIDGGEVGHILALGGIITTAISLLLYHSFLRAVGKAEKSSRNSD